MEPCSLVGWLLLWFIVGTHKHTCESFNLFTYKPSVNLATLRGYRLTSTQRWFRGFARKTIRRFRSLSEKQLGRNVVSHSTWLLRFPFSQSSVPHLTLVIIPTLTLSRKSFNELRLKTHRFWLILCTLWTSLHTLSRSHRGFHCDDSSSL